MMPERIGVVTEVTLRSDRTMFNDPRDMKLIDERSRCVCYSAVRPIGSPNTAGIGDTAKIEETHWFDKPAIFFISLDLMKPEIPTFDD